MDGTRDIRLSLVCTTEAEEAIAGIQYTWTRKERSSSPGVGVFLHEVCARFRTERENKQTRGGALDKRRTKPREEIWRSL